MLIAISLADHINENESAKQSFADKHNLSLTKKKELAIFNEFLPGCDNNWIELFPQFAELIKNNLSDENLNKFIQGDFSTTTDIVKASYQAVLMDSCKLFFEYTVYYRCGIPQIHLDGTTQDWENIYNKVESLSEYQLDSYLNKIRPILKQFIEASKGNIDKDFWNNIYKFNERCGSGHDYITGWINDLVLYVSLPWKKEKLLTSEFVKSSGTTVDMFGTGLSAIDFNWVVRGTKYSMQFLGGYIGTAYNQNENYVHPVIGCGVVEKVAK